MVDEQRLAALAKAKGGWVAQTNPHYGALIEAGLAEIQDGPDPDGDVFVTITEAGEKWLTASAKGEAPKLKLVEPAPVEEPEVEEAVGEPARLSDAANRVVETARERLEAQDPLQALASAPERSTVNGKSRSWSTGAEKPAEAPRRRRGRLVVPEPESSAQPAPLVPFVAAEFDLEPAPWNRPPVRKRFGAEKSPITRALRLDELPVGASIHIAATPEAPYPHRKYAHHVVAANRKYATPRRDAGGNVMLAPRGKRMMPIYDYERRFRIFKCAEDDPRGPGARIQRIDPSEGEN